jgi:nucleotide-binding universal stress UspA family protein
MFKHILLPTDGSKLSNKAVKQAIGIASALGVKITAVNVIGEFHLHRQFDGYAMPELPSLKKQFEETEAAGAEKILDAVKESARKSGVECNTVTVISAVPYDAIIKQATKSKCDLIVMASHGRTGLEALLLGSETVKVLTHSKIPVLVCR